MRKLLLLVAVVSCGRKPLPMCDDIRAPVDETLCTGHGLCDWKGTKCCRKARHTSTIDWECRKQNGR